MFVKKEWIPQIEKIEIEKKLEEDRVKNANPEVLLSEWLNENADQYKDGSYVRGDNLWDDMFDYMCSCGIEFVKASELNEIKEKAEQLRYMVANSNLFKEQNEIKTQLLLLEKIESNFT